MANKKDKEPKNKKSFFKDFKAELKKVIWPTPKQLINNTIAVVVIVIITASVVCALDLAFEALNKYGFNKIKEHYKNKGQETIEQTYDTNNITNVNGVQIVNSVDTNTTNGTAINNVSE